MCKRSPQPCYKENLEREKIVPLQLILNDLNDFYDLKCISLSYSYTSKARRKTMKNQTKPI